MGLGRLNDLKTKRKYLLGCHGTQKSQNHFIRISMALWHLEGSTDIISQILPSKLIPNTYQLIFQVFKYFKNDFKQPTHLQEGSKHFYYIKHQWLKD